MPRSIPLAALAALALSTGAGAATTGFQVRLSGSLNTPLVTLENLSDTARLTEFDLVLGDPTYAFDYVQGLGADEPLGGETTVIVGDNANDAVRTDRILLAFLGFDPGESINFGIDIDLADSPVSTSETFLEAFGILPDFAPASVTATFDDGSLLNLSFADAVQEIDASYLLAGTGTVPSPVPVPAGILLLASGLGAVAALRRRAGRHRVGGRPCNP